MHHDCHHHHPTYHHGDSVVTSSGRKKTVLLPLDYRADGFAAEDTIVERFGEWNLRGGTAPALL
jgi:hypothetical protein